MDVEQDKMLQLVAASEDRFLAMIGMPQQFGTLPVSVVPLAQGPLAITDQIRRLMHVAPLPSR